MKSKILIVILAIILIALLFNEFILQIIWISPNTETSVFPYITETIKEVDKAINNAVTIAKADRRDIKLLYTNAGGSGFLKNNPIPNDLDYSFAVYLGEYEYDGTNAKEIAEELENHMSSIQIQIYNYVNESNKCKLYSHHDTFESIQTLNKNRESHIDMMTQSIPQLFKRENYVVYSIKNIPYEDSDKEYSIVFPFILKKNEMLVENYDIVLLYSNNMKYSENTRPMLREIEIIADFYADIKSGNDVIHVEIIPESSRGNKLQLSKRIFAPSMFMGNISFNFLKNLDILNDDDQYIEYRIYDIKQHLLNMKNYVITNERPIKILKRILQVTDLIKPLLDEKTAQNITETTIDLLNNPQIKLINDYQTAHFNLLQISNKQMAYFSIGKENIDKHLDEMWHIISEMEETKLFDANLIDRIKLITTDLSTEKIKSEEDLIEYNKNARKQTKQLYDDLDKIVINLISDKVYKYPEILFEPLEKAGFHQIDICWLDKNLIGVLKDDFTTKIPEDKLKDMAQKNNLINVNYKLVDPKEASGPKIHHTVWVRYNSTDEENKAFEDIKNKFREDKKNLSIKRTLSYSLSHFQRIIKLNKN